LNRPNRRRCRPGRSQGCGADRARVDTLTIPEAEKEVSILGEKLTIERADGNATYTSVGRHRDHQQREMEYPVRRLRPEPPAFREAAPKAPAPKPGAETAPGPG